MDACGCYLVPWHGKRFGIGYLSGLSRRWPQDVLFGNRSARRRFVYDTKGRNAMALEVPYRSIPDLLSQRVAATPAKEALGYPTADGGVGWLTWAEVGRRADAIAAGLIG